MDKYHRLITLSPGTVAFLVLAGLAITAFIIYPFLTIFLMKFTVKRYGAHRYALIFKCTKCSRGVQWLNPRTHLWGPCPKSIHLERGRRLDGTPFFRSRQANVRGCACCVALGSHSYSYDPETQDPDTFHAPCYGERL
jgi:hypothetical protein